MPEPPEQVQTIETVYLEDDYQEATAKLEGEHPALTHSNRTIDGNKLIMTPNATMTALLLKGRIDPKLYTEAYEICKTVDDRLDSRPSAVGSHSMPRIKKNGQPGTYQVTPDSVMDVLDRHHVRQGLLGAVGGTATRPPYLSRLTRDRPELLEQLRTLIEEVNQLYVTYFPTFYEIQRAEVKRALEFRLWHTAFSSAYIPKNLRSGYHRDSWNLLGSMSALLPLGRFSGGELVLPRWRIAIAFKPGDVLLFNPQQLHGNAPIVGKRLSIVLYCARNLSRYDK